MNWVLAGLGGVLGGLSRFQIGSALSRRCNTVFPVATFLINLSGAFFLGVLMAASPQGRWYVFLGDGFLGAFTTFSTFMYEGTSLLREKERVRGFLYVAASLLLGIGAYTGGFFIAQRLFF